VAVGDTTTCHVLGDESTAIAEDTGRTVAAAAPTRTVSSAARPLSL